MYACSFGFKNLAIKSKGRYIVGPLYRMFTVSVIIIIYIAHMRSECSTCITLDSIMLYNINFVDNNNNINIVLL
jgi:hypothetical protein